MYISIDGCDGCGKDSQMDTIRDLLTMMDIPESRILMVWEPGCTEVGESLRHLMLHDTVGKGMDPEIQLLLMIASRLDLQNRVIKPFMDKMAALGYGKGDYAIISNRSYVSSFAYQSQANAQTRFIYHSLHKEELMTLPDIPIVLMVDPEESMRRLGNNLDNLENVSIESVTERAKNFETWVGVQRRLGNCVISISSQESIESTSRLLIKELVREVEKYRSLRSSSDSVGVL